MNIDKALKGLRESLGESAVDIEAGRERLRAAARRLRDDPAEARRIDDLAERFDHHEKDYRLGGRLCEGKTSARRSIISAARPSTATTRPLTGLP